MKPKNTVTEAYIINNNWRFKKKKKKKKSTVVVEDIIWFDKFERHDTC